VRAAASVVAGGGYNGAAMTRAEPLPLPDAVEDASFDPTTPPPPDQRRQWWGRHLQETRWLLELARLQADPLFWAPDRRDVPRGDGSPVVLIPGFLAGDPSLVVLGTWLSRIGWRPHRSGIAVNVDCSDRALDRLDRRVAEIAGRTGRKVALVGHSRGGHFAKALAHRHPERISAVVSMGSGLDTPFDISIPTRAAVAAVRWVHEHTTDRVARNGCLTATCRCRFAHDYTAAFPAEVALTSIYSRDDGVVWWEACTVPYARCVEVSGSHVGLAFNARAYLAVARALADAAAAAAPASAAPAAA
jgi:triacylglycerol lipase